MIFDGVGFLVAPSLRPATIAAIHRHGGLTVYGIPSATDKYGPDSVAVACAVQPDSEGDDSLGWNDNKENVDPMLRSRAAAVEKRHRMQPDYADHFSPSTIAYLRGRRIPIVYERYIFHCLLQNRFHLHCPSAVGCGADRGCPSAAADAFSSLAPLLAYNPFCMCGIEFTTTQLPRTIKANVIAAMVFYGGTYSPHLTRDTSLVVYSCVLASPSPPALSHRSSAETNMSVVGAADHVVEHLVVPAKPPSKLEMAQRHGIPCVPPSWVQDCVKYGQLLPFSASPAVAATPGRSAMLWTRRPPSKQHGADIAAATTTTTTSPPSPLAPMRASTHLPPSPATAAIKKAEAEGGGIGEVGTTPPGAPVASAAAGEAWDGIPSPAALSPADASRMLEAIVSVLDPAPCGCSSIALPPHCTSDGTSRRGAVATESAKPAAAGSSVSSTEGGSGYSHHHHHGNSRLEERRGSDSEGRTSEASLATVSTTSTAAAADAEADEGGGRANDGQEQPQRRVGKHRRGRPPATQRAKRCRRR